MVDIGREEWMALKVTISLRQAGSVAGLEFCCIESMGVRDGWVLKVARFDDYK